MKQQLLKPSSNERKIVGTIAKRAFVVVWLLIVLPLMFMAGGSDSVFNKFVAGLNISMYLLLVAYSILAVGALTWMVGPLFKKKSNHHAETQISAALIFFFLNLSFEQVCGAAAQEVVSTHTMAAAAASAPTQAGSVTITAANNPALLKTVAALGEEITPAELAVLLKTKGVTAVFDGTGPANLGLVGCVIITIIIVIVIGGMAYVFCKIVKRCRQIEEDKNKQLDDDEAAIINNVSAAGANGGATTTVIAASFINGTVPQQSGDEKGYEKRPFSFRYAVRAEGPISLVPNLGTTTMTADAYLAKHGLPPDLSWSQDCFAVNGLPTNTVPVISHLNGVVFIDAPGVNGRVVTFVERSPDLINWQTIRGVVAPTGTVVSFSDGESSEQQNFYRVLVK